MYFRPIARAVYLWMSTDDVPIDSDVVVHRSQ